MSVIALFPLASPPPDRRPFEAVERKGIGHPDTLCDVMAERASLLYARYCRATFGKVPHHWFDKVVLVGGEAEVKFGSGRLLRPYRVLFMGKAVQRVGTFEIPLAEILTQAARSVLGEYLTGFRPERDVEVEVLVQKAQGPGQPLSRYQPKGVEELDNLADCALVSNDCNVCVGFAPLTLLEQIVLFTERYLQSSEARAARPFLGSDIKLLGTRTEGNLCLLTNVPLLAEYVTSYADYLQKCDELTESIRNWIHTHFGDAIEVLVNPERRSGRAYLTVTGSVADTGDVGVTGRGNRANGLITPMRPMSIEASAGKNPLDHTGKLYTILASRLAQMVAETTSRHAVVTLATAKGTPLCEPDQLWVEIDDFQDLKLTGIIDEQIRSALARVHEISEDLLQGRVTLW